MNTIEYIGLTGLIPLVPGVAHWLNEVRLRKLAEVRLDLARTATHVNELMLAGEVTVGQICHDHFCRFILDSQLRHEFNMSWNLLRAISPAAIAIRKQLEEELETKERVRDILQVFVMKYANAFRYSRPLSFICFAAWVFTCRGGIQMIVATLKLVLRGAKSFIALQAGYQKFKREIGAVFLSMELASQGEEGPNMRDGNGISLAV
jgi:hypothetical protein